MTTSVDAHAAAPIAVPFPLRVAAVLCAVVGVLSVIGALAVSVPLIGSAARTWLPLVVNLTAALLACVAALMVWKRRKLSVLALVLAWALPSVTNLVAGAPVHGPSLLMVLALITLAANWAALH